MGAAALATWGDKRTTTPGAQTRDLEVVCTIDGVAALWAHYPMYVAKVSRTIIQGILPQRVVRKVLVFISRIGHTNP
jgi:hypothetical protein